ncbi:MULTISPECIES: DUF2892 domain-containing protein [Thermoactinomyces]|uniref:DUF2892 domain-containing protein n=1 Tax=Thermoactinomyces daqus TaxID=1329516 RepID=A0A7W2AIX8_9BACL|nr:MULTISPECIES: DUF2892 domain-containing protein [Thermoactinomyces]MBA4543358.1 DUF2892 domain-containing protein [Thermoactinomyces daqus]MBH8599488.1 DUF2892 domain-containing protein [Thermoactinomyces sp. CICC 10523]MBH8605276.1 DUF2892 domain-containing protein [Thermoactinomyces sp. CICC 10522]MBH8608141.1 DUF2892 domain-containing protein [Thermoactinomyces sp. CICC 10521]
MQKNIGTLDALLRITCGLVGLAWCTSKGRRNFPFLIALASAMKVAEGLTRYCPVLALFGKNTLGNKGNM